MVSGRPGEGSTVKARENTVGQMAEPRGPGAKAARKRRSFVRWIETAHPLDVNRSLESLVFVAGSGRSGTTWLGQLLNAENGFRFIFEPFNPRLGADGAELLPRYVPPEERDAGLRDEFLRYLHGRAGNAWTGQYNLRMLSSRRLIKDIHSNLRLGWFRRCFEPFPIVLVVRHPFAVAVSQLRIGLALELPYYLADSKLIADHLAPFENALRGARSEFAQRVLQWCVETYVPLRQLRESQRVTIVLYERLVADPQAVLEPIFRQLGLTMTPGSSPASCCRPRRRGGMERTSSACRPRRRRPGKDAWILETSKRASRPSSSSGCTASTGKAWSRSGTIRSRVVD